MLSLFVQPCHVSTSYHHSIAIILAAEQQIAQPNAHTILCILLSQSLSQHHYIDSFASSTMAINSPRSKAGTSPGLPEYTPPILVPPTKTFGKDDWPVISKRAALFSGDSMRPGIHSFPNDTSLKLIPMLFNNDTASVQNGEYSYVSFCVLFYCPMANNEVSVQVNY